MNFYLAPLEGVTGHVFRRAYDEVFGDADLYFTPFISANDHLSVASKKELSTVLSAPLVPQILGNDPQKVLAAADEMADLGFTEFNLNFGCPSGTVCGKNRGSGMLKDLDYMDRFLDRIFSEGKYQFSLKTRIGWSDESQWKDIVEIYAAYPFTEIIIHPRLRQDLYRGYCRRDAFEYALTHLTQPLCYNGDICSVQDYLELVEQFPTLERVMMGRGIVRNPLLISQIKALPGRSRSESQETSGSLNSSGSRSLSGSLKMSGDSYMDLTAKQQAMLRTFVRKLEAGYLADMDREEYAVMRMKEFFGYFGTYFPGREKALKELKKTKNLQEYRLSVAQFL